MRKEGEDAKSLGDNVHSSFPHSLVDLLKTLDLHGVGVTATIEPDGTLRPVGGLWEKLGAQTMDYVQRGLLQIVVVAADQTDVPTEYLREDAEPLRVLKASTVADAVHQLTTQTGARRAIIEYEREACQSLDMLGRPVSLEYHYQHLPLLRSVKREFLLTDAHLPDMGEDFDPALRQADILRWEEELREELITYEQVAVADVFQSFQRYVDTAMQESPRFVVLGPPGSGKTTFIQYLAWQAASRNIQLFGRLLLPVRVRLRDWEAWSCGAASEEPGNERIFAQLPQYLAERYKLLSSAPSAEYWQRWLQRGEVLLLLDGLDEISGTPSFITTLKESLLVFRSCPTALTCRTVSFEHHQTVCADFPIFTLGGLDEATRDTYIRNFPAEHPDSYQPQQLIDQLNQTYQLLPLAANPLLLSIICYVVDDLRGARIPPTRAALYRRALEKLLARRPKRVSITYPGEEPSLGEKLTLLQQTALYLFAKGDRRLTFTEHEFGQTLKQALSTAGYGTTPAPWANALRADLTHNSGVLRGGNEQDIFFLHLTVQEFLVSAALASMVNDHGWQVSVEIGDMKYGFTQFLDKKAWDPRWQEVITLLAGQLNDPQPLFDILANDKKDDLFKHRATLAAMCLPEVSFEVNRSYQAGIDQITKLTFPAWFAYEKTGTSAAVPHLTRALPALGQINGNIHGTALLDWLCRQLREPQRDLQASAAEALGHMGQVAAYSPTVLTALGDTIQGRDAFVATKAVEALRRMGPVATRHPSIPPILARTALTTEDWFVRAGILRVFQQMGSATTQRAEVLPMFFAALDDNQPHVRANAAEALGQLPLSATQISAVREALFVVLNDQQEEDESVRAEVRTALDRLSQTTAELLAIPPIQPTQSLRASVPQKTEPRFALVTALQGENVEKRRAAAEALGRAGRVAIQDEEEAGVPMLSRALYDEDSGVRAEAARALGQIGDRAAQSSEILPNLVQLALYDPDSGVRAQAVETLGQLRKSIADSPQILDALITVLRGKDTGVRVQAARTLGQIGRAVARHPKGIPALMNALHDENSAVRTRAAEALGKIMAQGVRFFRRWWGKIEARDMESLTRL
ncbi:MAG: HEAT repeat domain-containing protein [Candidatus Binatia bacterium]